MVTDAVTASVDEVIQLAIENNMDDAWEPYDISKLQYMLRGTVTKKHIEDTLVVTVVTPVVMVTDPHGEDGGVY